MGAQPKKQVSSTVLLTALRPAIACGRWADPRTWDGEMLCSGLEENEFL